MFLFLLFTFSPFCHVTYLINVVTLFVELSICLVNVPQYGMI